MREDPRSRRGGCPRTYLLDPKESEKHKKLSSRME